MTLLRIVTPIGLFLLALGVRLLSWHSVFQGEGVIRTATTPTIICVASASRSTTSRTS